MLAVPRRARRVLVGLGALTVGGLVMAASQAGPAPAATVRDAPTTVTTTTTAYAAIADTQIGTAAPGANSGSAVRMATCGFGPPTCSSDASQEKRALVKFDAGGLTGAVTSARLRYYAGSTPVPALSVQVITDNSWGELTATWNNSNALPVGPDTFTSPAGSTQGYYEADVTAAVSAAGTYSFRIVNPTTTTLRLVTRESTAPAAPPQLVVTTDAGPPADPVIAAAGDISTRTAVGGNKLTSDVIASINPDAILPLGDDQYPAGALADYQSFFAPTWGRFQSRIRPTPGNHEYVTDTTAAGYFSYFGPAASPQEGTCTAACRGYYSYDLGTWHIIALNTNDECKYVACGAGSAQIQWLQADLAGTAQSCVLAYFHHPRWSSGTHHPSDKLMGPIWDTLYAAHADVVLNGHEHNYERFAKQDPAGNLDRAAGIREFVVGTGGNGLYALGTILPNSEASNATTKGVLKLTLHPGSYDWQFQPAAGYAFTEAGSDTCS